MLFKGGAGNIMDSVIPSMLLSLEAGGAKATQALEGLRVILGVKPTVLASMVPKLLKAPAASTRIRALGSLAEAAGASVKKKKEKCMRGACPAMKRRQRPCCV